MPRPQRIYTNGHIAGNRKLHHYRRQRFVYPTLTPWEASMLTDCGSIFYAATGSCWIAVGCDMSRLNSYPNAFTSFVYICTSN